MPEPKEAKAGLSAAAKFVGGWFNLMSGGLSVPFAVLAAVNQGNEQKYLALCAFITLGWFCVSLIRQLLRLRAKITPALKIECGELVTDSVSRNWPTGPYPGMPTDFLGFVITNIGHKEIKDCQAFLVRVEREGVLVWTKTIALSFEPHSRTENEPVEKVSIPNAIPRSVCLCSIDHRNEIMPGSLNQTSRYGLLFHRALSDHGEYSFHVSIACKGKQTRHETFMITWRGTRDGAKIKPYSSHP